MGHSGSDKFKHNFDICEQNSLQDDTNMVYF